MASRYAPKQFKAAEWKENLNDLRFFVNNLSPEETIVLLKDKEFKEKLCKHIENVNYAEVLEVLTSEETKILIDQKFVDLMENKSEHAFKMFYSRVDSETIGEILLHDFAIPLMHIEAIIDSFNSTWSMEVKSKIYWTAVDDLDINNPALARLTRELYFKSYEIGVDEDYSQNERDITMVSKFLQEDFLKQRYFEDVSLLMSLDPQNRARLYKDKNYAVFNKRDKQNLIELLSAGYETILPSTILNDCDFINDVAHIQDVNKYRMARLSIREQSEEAYNQIEEEKNRVVHRCVTIITNNSFKDFKKFDLTPNEMINAVFYKYFKCSPRDVYIKATVIKDAMNSFENYQDKFSEDGIELINKLIEMLTTQDDLKDKQNYNSWGDFVELNEENFEILQEIVYLLSKKNNWQQLFDNAINVARINFETQLNSALYGLEEKNIVQNKEGLTVYDITKLKHFHLLVHRKKIYDTAGYKFPQIEKGGYLNTSMSILNNNHLGTFGHEMEETDIIFGYCSIKPNELVHALCVDSFTERVGIQGRVVNKKHKEVETKYAPVYMDLYDFMANMNPSKDAYNEVKLHMTANCIDKYDRKFVKPDYILCKNEIRDIDKEIAKKFNLPIVFVNEREVERYNEDNYVPTVLYQSRSSLKGAFEYSNAFIEQ